MASDYRANKAGFAREVQEKLSQKFDGVEAAKSLRWIRLLTVPTEIPAFFKEAAEKIPSDVQSVDMKEYTGYLSSGVVLGYIMACLDPKVINTLSTVKTWQLSDKPVFETSRQRDRIGLFLRFTAEFGVHSTFQFQTEQLYEMTNPGQVVICLSQLGIEAQAKPGYNGPAGFWMQKHKENRRDFTEQQLRSGETVIGLQMGTNAGANASGVSFGARRHITDSH